MRALGVTRPGEPLEEVEVADPAVEGTSVLVDVTRCGVCHSDVHFWEGWLDFGGQKRTLADMGIELPAVLGHEILGTVSAAGPDASGAEIGETRIVYPWIGCGDCVMCRAERDDLCQQQRALGVQQHGGFGDKVVVPHPKYLIDPEGLDLGWAATLACSGLTAYAAVRKVLPLEPLEAVVVIGAGGVGLSTIGVLKALRHENIVAVDIEDSHLDAARQGGAAQVVNSRSAGDPLAAVMQAAGGEVAAVIDLVNSQHTAPLAFALPRRGGRVIPVGLFGGAFPLPLAAVPVRALRIEGSYVGSLQELRELVELAKSGKLKPPPVREVPREEASDTLAGLRDGRIVGRVVLARE